MRSYRWLGVGLLAGSLTGLMAAKLPATPPQEPAAKSKARWEHKTVFNVTGGDPQQFLDKWAEDGWELAAIAARGREEVFVFKRPKR